jgi:hypothetical protein
LTSRAQPPKAAGDRLVTRPEDLGDATECRPPVELQCLQQVQVECVERGYSTGTLTLE